MTLEQFAKKAGVQLVKCNAKDWGGPIGYTKKSSNCTVAGFRSANAAYKHWLESTFGEGPGRAVISLLRQSERDASK